VEQATGLGTIGYWPEFQQVLTDDDRFIWEWLGVRRRASNVPSTLPELRILDVPLWMSVETGEKH
jgi:hypothetical protein